LKKIYFYFKIRETASFFANFKIKSNRKTPIGVWSRNKGYLFPYRTKCNPAECLFARRESPEAFATNLAWCPLQNKPLPALFTFKFSPYGLAHFQRKQ
jgi:hypothetical protein